MVGQEKENGTDLNPVSRWILAIFSILFGLVMLLWAQGQEAWKVIPAIFCFIIAGVCILPQPIKGWRGNIIGYYKEHSEIGGVLYGCTEYLWEDAL
ncbi:hypothetical protein BTA51_14115 [Hahella sp. CCB-MM4]|uniref:hypothetical protein n=1 Tax=Hahella sp. (strain CCB-MM4) TaxID=1926491 RepID=UPI000B9C0CD3|nr:hypothetical protein [Hahella sp. CCB-MM4]OZG72660.1 hypothetical protein BTA51_14115 [Hahella sp. CCB-MM4]